MRELERCATLMQTAHDVPHCAILRANSRYLHHLQFDDQFYNRTQYWMWVYHAFCKVWYESKKDTKILIEIGWANNTKIDSVVFEKKRNTQDVLRPQEFFRLISESSPDMVEKPRHWGVDWGDLSILALEYYLECEKEKNDPSPEAFSVEDLL